MRTLRKYDRLPAAAGEPAAAGATASNANTSGTMDSGVMASSSPFSGTISEYAVAVEQLPEGTLFLLKPIGRRTAAHRTDTAQADRNSAGRITAARVFRRSEERRVGKGFVNTCKYRWSLKH